MRAILEYGSSVLFVDEAYQVSSIIISIIHSSLVRRWLRAYPSDRLQPSMLPEKVAKC